MTVRQRRRQRRRSSGRASNPDITARELLPTGIHDCLLNEIKTRFGSFQSSDRRPQLFARLEELVTAMKQSGLFESILVDGSFVTSKGTPNDVDILGVPRAGQDFERELPVSEYALVSRAMLRRRFGFDVVVVEKSSFVYETYVEFFGR